MTTTRLDVPDGEEAVRCREVNRGRPWPARPRGPSPACRAPGTGCWPTPRGSVPRPRSRRPFEPLRHVPGRDRLRGTIDKHHEVVPARDLRQRFERFAANRPKPRRFARQLPSIPIRITFPSGMDGRDLDQKHRAVTERESRRESTSHERLGRGDPAHQAVDPRMRHPNLKTSSGRMAAPVGAGEPRPNLLRRAGRQLAWVARHTAKPVSAKTRPVDRVANRQAPCSSAAPRSLSAGERGGARGRPRAVSHPASAGARRSTSPHQSAPPETAVPGRHALDQGKPVSPAPPPAGELESRPTICSISGRSARRTAPRRSRSPHRAQVEPRLPLSASASHQAAIRHIPCDHQCAASTSASRAK